MVLVHMILFDCDGVLVDSEVIACGVFADKVAARVPTLDRRDFASGIFGFSDEQILARVEADQGVRFPAGFLDDVKAAIEAALVSDLQPIAGVAAALDAIAQPKAVVSNSPRARVERSLDRAGVRHHFGDAVYCGDMVERQKPFPDLYLMAAGRHGCDPADCLVVEDSVTGVSAGVAAGMTVLGFLGGSHIVDGHGARLLAAGASAVVDRMERLPDLIATRSSI